MRWTRPCELSLIMVGSSSRSSYGVRSNTSPFRLIVDDLDACLMDEQNVKEENFLEWWKNRNETFQPRSDCSIYQWSLFVVWNFSLNKVQRLDHHPSNLVLSTVELQRSSYEEFHWDDFDYLLILLRLLSSNFNEKSSRYLHIRPVWYDKRNLLVSCESMMKNIPQIKKSILRWFLL